MNCRALTELTHEKTPRSDLNEGRRGSVYTSCLWAQRTSNTPPPHLIPKLKRTRPLPLGVKGQESHTQQTNRKIGLKPNFWTEDVCFDAFFHIKRFIKVQKGSYQSSQDRNQKNKEGEISLPSCSLALPSPPICLSRRPMKPNVGVSEGAMWSRVHLSPYVSGYRPGLEPHSGHS